jgi:pimeloyl-ACP methyl ester carboxylesterase
MRVAGAGVELEVRERGRAGAPPLVLVHGFPDTRRVWDEVAELLADRFRVITYDVRGTGASGAPDGGAAGYTMELLVADLAAVLDAVSPDGPAHLVGHDWGGFQVWAAAADPAVRERIASFTAIASPALDQTGGWLRARLWRPSRRGIRELLGQARRSYYIALFQLPRLPEAVLRRAPRRAIDAFARGEGFEARDGHPAATLRRDAANGTNLYRANLGRPRQLLRRADPVRVPVQVIVPTGDLHISPALYDDCGRWAESVVRRDIEAGHWVLRTHAELIAGWIAEHAEKMGASKRTPAPAPRA